MSHSGAVCLEDEGQSPPSVFLLKPLYFYPKLSFHLLMLPMVHDRMHQLPTHAHLPRNVSHQTSYRQKYNHVTKFTICKVNKLSIKIV